MRQGALIGMAFGLVWWLVGAGALAQPARGPVQAIGIVLFGGAAVRAWRLPREARGRPRWGFYAVTVVGEVVAILLAQGWLEAHGREALLLPAVGVIVGLHFIGLWLVFARRRFLALSAAMSGLNLVALAPGWSAPARLAVSGFGSAAALLATALWP